MKKYFILLILFYNILPLCAKTIYLDELNVSYILQDWGSAKANANVLGMPISINGQVYQRGVGTHSISRFLLNLDGKAKSFSGAVGADDYNDFRTKMEFKIIADQKEIWTSGLMTKGMPAKEFRVDLKNVKKILLLVCEGGDGIMYDHANWLDAKFETDGDIFPEEARAEVISKEKYILTPAAPSLPQINSPMVFGVRPSNPFMYSIVASGKRPMKFSVDQLPAGLLLDSLTGIISGTLMQRGDYSVTVQASNDEGTDSRSVVFKVGDKINLTPPMGWNSWNCWALGVDAQKIKDAADQISDKLIDYGWSYVCIDDGWEAAERTADGELLGNAKFPDMKRLADYIHAKGLKFGIYSSPGPLTCGEFLGSYQHEDQDTETWAKWGVDLLKYDYCYYNRIAPKNPLEGDIKKPFFDMRRSLDRVNRDISYCVGYGAPNVWFWGKEAGGNYWRTTRDITDEWNVVTAIGCFQDVCSFVTAPGGYNDPDMLVVGKLGLAWRAEVKESLLTPDEQYSHVSLWSLLSAPLFIGCDLNDMDAFTFGLLTNNEVLGVNQDPHAQPAHKILTDNGQIWYKTLYDGSVAVGFFNIDPYEVTWDKSKKGDIQNAQYSITLDLNEIGLRDEYIIRDLWRKENIGTASAKYTAQVPYHGVHFVELIPQNK